MIRTARPADLPLLVALEVELFGADAWDEAALRAELDGSGRTFLVLDSEPEGVVGYAVTLAAGDLVDLTRIAVSPARQRGGVATLLLDEALALAGGGEADRVLLEVSATNAGALAFYARHGFVAIDTRRRYYRDGSDAVVMMRPLSGEDGAHA